MARWGGFGTWSDGSAIWGRVGDGTDYLFDPYYPADKVPVVVASLKAQDYEETGDTVHVYGSPGARFVAEARSYFSGDLVLHTLTDADREALGGLLSSGRVLGFIPGYTTYGFLAPTYFYVGKMEVSRVSPLAMAKERKWSLAVQRVEAPVVA